jgi:hypothetical protein
MDDWCDSRKHTLKQQDMTASLNNRVVALQESKRPAQPPNQVANLLLSS